jgi:hypothetical protein
MNKALYETGTFTRYSIDQVILPLESSMDYKRNRLLGRAVRFLQGKNDIPKPDVVITLPGKLWVLRSCRCMSTTKFNPDIPQYEFIVIEEENSPVVRP